MSPVWDVFGVKKCRMELCFKLPTVWCSSGGGFVVGLDVSSPICKWVKSSSEVSRSAGSE